MPTFKLTLAYDGTGLVGWQRQASGTSVQGLLEDAAAELEGRPAPAVAAGRTDAGVHALGQVVSLVLERAIDGPSLRRALNAKLPGSIRVLDAAEAAPGFHARFDAVSKTYRYRLSNSEVMSPFDRGYAWHVPAPLLDVAKMADAAAACEGRHDFVAFQAAGSLSRSTDRTVFAARVSRAPGSPFLTGSSVAGSADPCASGVLITFEITGDGFLRHMVRTLMGTLVEVGRGRRSAGWVSELFESGDRALAGPTAPPDGLFLTRVDYGQPSS
jgi:tRNA pseudouridine38-40 synthase